MDNRNFYLGERIKSRLLIVEGCDCSGKTTLIKHILHNKTQGDMVVHHDRYKHVQNHLARLTFEACIPALLGLTDDLIMDRGPISEFVYSPIYRKQEPRIDMVQLRMMHRVMMRAQFGMIFCDPGLAKILEVYETRIALEYVKDHISLTKIYDGFQSAFVQLAEMFGNQLTHYNYMKMSPREAIEDSVMGMTSAHYQGIPTGGNWLGDVVLVGARFGHVRDSDSWFQVPYFSFARESDSYAFTKALEKAGILERKLFWTNADQLLDEATAYKIIRPELNRPIVALNPYAAERLAMFGLDYVEVKGLHVGNYSNATSIILECLDKR